MKGQNTNALTSPLPHVVPLLSMFFGLCSPSGVQLQVAPRKYGASDTDQPGTPSPTRKVDLIRLKPQPSQSSDIPLAGSKVLSLNVEDELFLFVNCVLFCSERAASSLDGFPSSLNCYTFESNSVVFSSTLAVLLSKCVLRHTNALGRDVPVSRVASAKTLLATQQHDTAPSFSSACKNLSLLLSSYVSNPDNGRSHQSGVSVRVKSIGSGLNCLENVLIVTDILLLAVMDYVHGNETAIEDSTLLYEVAKLYRTFVMYVLSAPPSTTNSIATHMVHSSIDMVSCLYARIIGKCCLLVRIICSHSLKASQQGGTVLSENVRMSLEDSAQLMQTNAEAINYLSVLVQRESNTNSSGMALCGYYHCTMLYWNVCSELLLLLQHFSITQSLTRTNTHNNISLLYTDETKSGQTGNTGAPQSTHMWQSLQFRVYNAMLSTAPTIEQLHYELYRIEQYHNSTISSDDAYCVQQLNRLITTDNNNQTPLLSAEQCTFKLRFILSGIAKLFTTIDSIRPTRLQLPTPISAPAQFNENKWLTALAEMLLATLTKARSGNNGIILIYAPYLAEQLLLRTSDKHVDRSATTNWIYWNLAKSLGEFTYLLHRQSRSLQNQANVSHRSSHNHSGAGRLSGIHSAAGAVSHNASGRALHTTALLQASQANQASTHAGQSAYSIAQSNGQSIGQGHNELTGRTSERSTDRTARLSSINNLNKNLGASASGPNLTSPTGHGQNSNNSLFDPNRSLKSNSSAHSRSLPPITNNNSVPNNYNNINTNNNNNTSNIANTVGSPTAEALPVFSVNDRVDGHCTLPNGSKRWYPGQITSAEYDQNKKQFVYTIKYNDGEERGHQTANDIRYPKKRKPRTRTSSRADDDFSDSGYESTRTTILHRQTSHDSGDEYSVAHSVGFSVNNSLNLEAEASLWAARQQTPLSNNPSLALSFPVHAGVANVVSISEDAELVNTTLPTLSPAPLAITNNNATLNATNLEVEATTVEYWEENCISPTAHGNCEEGGNGNRSDSEDEEDGIFEIPRTLEGHRSLTSAGTGGGLSSKKLKESLVPRIKFEDLDRSSGSFHQAASGGSLSGALLSDATSVRNSSVGINNNFNNGFNSFRTNNGDGTSRSYKAGMVSQMTSHRSYFDNNSLSVSGDDHGASFPYFTVQNALPSHRLNDPSYMDAPNTGGNTRLPPWHANEDATHLSGSTTHFSARMPPTQPSSAHSAAQEKVLRKAFGSGNGAFMDTPVDQNESFLPPVEYREYLGLGVGLTDANVKLLLKTYSIICAVLVQRAVVHYSPDVSATPAVSSSSKDAPTCLDYTLCTNRTDNSSPVYPKRPFNGTPLASGAMSPDGTNVLFNVREFLEILSDTERAPNVPGGSTFSGLSAVSLLSPPGVVPGSIPASLERPASGAGNCPAVLPAGAQVASSIQSTSVHNGLAALSVLQNAASLRLCKMLSSAYLKHSCLIKHMNSSSTSNGRRLAEKIGEGGFGTVFKLTCDCASGGAVQYSTCVVCYQQQHKNICKKSSRVCRCWRAHCQNSTSKTNHNNRQFAIKRVPRERSIHDPSRLYDLFFEISALELLRQSNAIGACGLEDYGVVGSEYWIVMELGLQNLEEWRTGHASPRGSGVSPTLELANPGSAISQSALTKRQVAACLLVYVDALYVLESVHRADIAHFDVKCSNFVFRASATASSAEPSSHFHLRDASESPLDLVEMHTFHQNNLPSGMVFLADFGEAVPYISHTQSYEQVKSRCRGTLYTQSPEMLCISQTSSATGTGSAVGTPALTAPQSPVNTPVPNSAPGYVRNLKNPRRLFPLPNAISDIWSMGCLLVELLTALPLFAEKPWPELYSTLCMENYTMLDALIPMSIAEALSGVSCVIGRAVEFIVRSALQQMPADRSSLSELIQQVDALLTEHFSEFITHPTNAAAAAVAAAMQESAVPDDTADFIDSEFDFTSLRSASSYLQGAAGNDILLPVSDSLFVSLSAETLDLKTILRTTAGTTKAEPEKDGAIIHYLRELDTQIVESDLSSVARRQALSLLQSQLSGAYGSSPIVVVVRVADTPVVAALNTRTDGGRSDISPCVVYMDLIVSEALHNVGALSASVKKILEQVRSVVQSERNNNSQVVVIVERVAPPMAHNAVTTSVTTVITAVIQDILDHSSPSRCDGLSQMIRLWRALPSLRAECCVELVHALYRACKSVD